MVDFRNLKESESSTQTVWNAIRSRGAELYAEYCRAPIGAHSPDLQFVLQHFRKAPVKDKFVLVALVPHRKWALGKLTGVRGDPVRVNAAITFDDLDDAERYVFRQRWKSLTGIDLEPSMEGSA